MKAIFYKILLIFVTVTTLNSCFVIKQSRKTVDNIFGFHFKGKKQSYAKIPFELMSNLLVVKVTIDNSDTLNFILDTGVSSTLITDPAIGDRIGLNYVRNVKISGAGEGEAITANVSIGHTLTLGEDIIANQQNIVVLNEDILNLSEYLGLPVHGIFGHELFDSFAITIDFENKFLHFNNPSKFRYKKSFGKKYPIVLTKSKPYTEAFSLSTNGNLRPLKLVIDTGAAHALMLNPYDESKIVNLPEKYIRANLGRGLNGEIFGQLGRVEMIKMGDVEINNILASFPDSISFSMKFPPSDFDRQGSIGCELLRRFKVTLNYQEGYIALKPIKKRIKEAFEHDMSGLNIRADGEKYNRFFIKTVDDNSPAGNSGLKVGDEIVFINNKSVIDFKLNDIVKILTQKEGKDVELFVRRDGNLIFFYFTLKRFI